MFSAFDQFLLVQRLDSRLEFRTGSPVGYSKDTPVARMVKGIHGGDLWVGTDVMVDVFEMRFALRVAKVQSEEQRGARRKEDVPRRVL